MKATKMHNKISELEASTKELKIVEKEVRQQNTFLNTILESLPHPFYVIDANDYTILKANSATGEQEVSQTITCYELTHKRSKPCSDRDHPCPLQVAKKTKKIVTVEHLHYDSEGNPRFVEISAHPILDDKGKVTQVIECALDITERKQSVEKLRESEERFRAIFETAQDLIFLKDCDLKYTAVNPAMERYYGVSASELIGKTSATLLGKKVSARSREEDLRVLNGEIIDTEHSFQLQEKSVTHNVIEVPIHNSSGEIIGLCGIARDITERVQAEEALRKSEEKFKFLAENMADIIWTLDLDFRSTYVSPSIEKVLGFTQEERSRQTLEEMVTPQSLKVIRTILDDELHREKTTPVDPNRSIAIEIEFYKKDGSTIWLENRVKWIRDDRGAVTGIHGVSRDISERKRAEEELRESEAKYRNLFEHTKDAIILADAQTGIIIDVNQAACNMMDLPRKKIVGMLQSQLHPPDEIERYQNIFREHVENKVAITEELFVQRPDSKRIPVDISASVTELAGRSIIQGSFRDITARRRAEEELRESEEHYRQLIEISPEAIIVQHNKKIVLANTAAARLVGAATFEQVKGKPIEYFVHPHYRKAVNNRIRRVIDKQTAVPFIEQKFIRLDGRIINVEVAATPFSYQSKPAVQIVVRDISERKQAEEHRKESFQRLRRSLEETVSSLASTIEKRDAATAGHQKRVANLACAIAEEMGFSGDQIDGIRMAGLIHDIGKIYVPSDILNTSRRLTGPEFEMFKSHCQVGYEILKTIDFPWPVAPVVLQHHERQDGSGYPQGLCGEDIIFEARILAVADVIEAMSNHRPYRPAYSIGDALEEILHHKDSLYDPEVVDACLRVFYDKGFTFKEEETEM